MDRVYKKYVADNHWEIIIYEKQTDVCFIKKNMKDGEPRKIKFLTVMDKNDTRQKHFMTTDRYFDYLVSHEGFKEC